MAIYAPGKGLPEERTVFGTRQDAEATARSMINAWLKKRDKARGSPDKRRKAVGIAEEVINFAVHLHPNRVRTHGNNGWSRCVT